LQRHPNAVGYRLFLGKDVSELKTVCHFIREIIFQKNKQIAFLFFQSIHSYFFYRERKPLPHNDLATIAPQLALKKSYTNKNKFHWR
jgi:hypothetical protein